MGRTKQCPGRKRLINFLLFLHHFQQRHHLFFRFRHAAPNPFLNPTADPVERVSRGVDDTLYGSLAIYRQEVIDELIIWMENHSEAEMDTAVRAAIATLPEEDQAAYIQAWEEILR